MKLKDILTKKPIDCIMVRIIVPKEFRINNEKEYLIGYCKWDGQKLIPLDGEHYSVNAKIIDYTFDTNIQGIGLICWEESGI